MILVVCPNLAVDVTLEVDALRAGGVHRARASSRQAGGKGVNVARALRALGEDVLVVGFAGGRRGEEIAEGLAGEGIRADLVAFPGESRTCTILLTPDGTATVVNEPGPLIEDETPLVEKGTAWLEAASAVALMGSLPPGLPSGTYRALIEQARARDRLCLVDTTGGALREALAGRPDVAKPNRNEAEELLGRSIDSPSSAAEAARELCRLGAGTALVTLGSQGFVVADPDVAAHCSASSSSDLRLGNPTGAGDALAAGFLAGAVRGYPLAERARLGAAAAVASLAQGYGRIRARDVRVDGIRFEVLSTG